MTQAQNVPVKAGHGRPVQAENVWEPLARARGEFDRLFDEFWHRPMGVGLTRRIQAFNGPALEFKDKGDEYELVADVPGLKADDIELKVADGFLRLSGERKEELEESNEAYLFSERRYGRFERAVELPHGIDFKNISAKAENGVLHIHLPKSADAKERERRIPIST